MNPLKPLAAAIVLSLPALVHAAPYEYRYPIAGLKAAPAPAPEPSGSPEPGDPAVWAQFANDHRLSAPGDWNGISWQNKNLTCLPGDTGCSGYALEYYPNANPTGTLYLTDNSLTNVDGLASLQSVGGNLTLHSNSLTNVDGLASLQSVGGYLYLSGNNSLTNVDGLASLQSVGGTLTLHSNSLTNVDGLASLQSVSGYLHLGYNSLTNVDGLASLQSVGGNLSLHSNNLTNVDGLVNVDVGGDVRIDNTYAGPKLPADSRFCTLNSAAQFPSGYAAKSKVCE